MQVPQALYKLRLAQESLPAHGLTTAQQLHCYRYHPYCSIHQRCGRNLVMSCRHFRYALQATQVASQVPAHVPAEHSQGQCMACLPAGLSGVLCRALASLRDERLFLKTLICTKYCRLYIAISGRTTPYEPLPSSMPLPSSSKSKLRSLVLPEELFCRRARRDSGRLPWDTPPARRLNCRQVSQMAGTAVKTEHRTDNDHLRHEKWVLAAPEVTE